MMDKEETILKELFQQLKQGDKRLATSFAATRAAAQARLELRGQPWRGWRFAVVAVSLLLVAGIVGWRLWGTVYVKQPRRQAQVVMPAPSVSPEPQPSPLLAQVPERASPPMSSRSRRRVGVSHHALAGNVEDAEVVTRFYSLVDDDELAPLESGQVMRVEVPASALIQFDLLVTLEALTQPVQADLVIGQDGLARAIRFLPVTQTTKTQ
jgi:hypothetical protein